MLRYCRSPVTLSLLVIENNRVCRAVARCGGGRGAAGEKVGGGAVRETGPGARRAAECAGRCGSAAAVAVLSVLPLCCCVVRRAALADAAVSSSVAAWPRLLLSRPVSAALLSSCRRRAVILRCRRRARPQAAVPLGEVDGGLRGSRSWAAQDHAAWAAARPARPDRRSASANARACHLVLGWGWNERGGPRQRVKAMVVIILAVGRPRLILFFAFGGC